MPSGVFLRWMLAGLLSLLLPLAQAQAQAQALSLEAPTTAALGQSMRFLVEKNGRLSLDEAIERQGQGEFKAIGAAVPKFGIGVQPVWLQLAVTNQSDSVLRRHLVVETSWLDYLDVFYQAANQAPVRWLAGDAETSLIHPLPGVGYVFDIDFLPGDAEIYLRVATPDPMVLPVRLLSTGQLSVLKRQYDYGYGLLYGFLFALIAYNAMLYLGLRERSYLDYCLYLGSFVLANLAYTGHGYAYLWPEWPGFQQYVILVLMALFSFMGLRFACGFLNLREHAPRLFRIARIFSLLGLSLVLLSTFAGQQAIAAGVAFVFVLFFSVAMVWFGLVTVRLGRVPGRYFLLAAVVAMFGTAGTALTVWWGLPYTQIGFHAAGWGVVAEGMLLALALAYRMRETQRKRILAERLARIDPLTSLLNRRAFMEQAGAVWSTASRNQRPLAVIMGDLDFFKSINDQHGHGVGDQVLVEVSRVLLETCRSGDLAARWGGEEFVVVLPETDAAKATRLAERLRHEIGRLRVSNGIRTISFTASFGVAERGAHQTLDELIADADRSLYDAKSQGRDRVCCALAEEVES